MPDVSTSIINEHDLEVCHHPGTDLGDRTTIGVGPTVDAYFEPRTLEELHRIRTLAEAQHMPLVVLGGGSNTVFTEQARETIIVHLRHFSETTVDENGGVYRVRAGAGAQWPTLIRTVTDAGWKTFGRLAGIPGTVGGALAGNAGTRRGEVSEFVRDVYILDPNGAEKIRKPDPSFSYRSSNLRDDVIIEATFEGTNREEDLADPPAGDIHEKRMDSQPISDRNAGCMFKNPPDDSAGRLIDDAGLKGVSRGGAVVSETHANFIVNQDDATPEDVLSLMNVVEQRVREEHGVSLEREIQII